MTTLLLVIIAVLLLTIVFLFYVIGNNDTEARKRENKLIQDLDAIYDMQLKNFMMRHNLDNE